MEVQSPDCEIAFGLPNQAWIEPASSVQEMPCRLQNEQSRDTCIIPDLPGRTSHGGLQNQSPFSLVANRRRTEAGCPECEMPATPAGCPECEMPATPARDDTPSPVRDITKRVQQMDGPLGRLGVTTPRPLATGDALRAIESLPPKTDSRIEKPPSPQMIALGELEFDQIFLIHVYLAG